MITSTAEEAGGETGSGGAEGRPEYGGVRAGESHAGEQEFSVTCQPASPVGESCEEF